VLIQISANYWRRWRKSFY